MDKFLSKFGYDITTMEHARKKEWMMTALLCVLLSCASFPPVWHHWDPYISPKWYAAGMGILILACYVLLGLADTSWSLLQRSWNRAALLTLSWLLAAVFFQLQNDGYSGTVPFWPYDNPSGLALAQGGQMFCSSPSRKDLEAFRLRDT